MKKVIMILALVALSLPALATSTPAPLPAKQDQLQWQGQKQQQQQQLDLSLMNKVTTSAAGGQGFGGSVRGGDSYAVMGGGAAPLPGGLCPKGDTWFVKILWGALELDFSQTRSEMECLDKVLNAWRDVAKPAPVVNYIAMQPPVDKAPKVAKKDEAAPGAACRKEEPPKAKEPAKKQPKASAAKPAKSSANGRCT